VATPRATGPGFSAYAWAATAEEVAARHGLSPAHVLRFDANLPALPAPLPVPPREVLAERGEYPEGSYRGLREAAAAYSGCAPEQIVVDAGADGLLHLVARTFLAAGRRAVVERPTYPLYAIASRIEGAAVEEVEGDLAALERAARGADVLWLCNPGNPGGELAEPAEIGRLADALPETLVCVDEAYFEYCGETTAPLARTRGNLVAVRTLSKAFGLAGLRVGYAVASPAVARELSARRAPAPIANAAALLAAAALQDPGPARAEAAAAREERERLRRGFLDGGFEAPATHTNFVVVRTGEAPELVARLERRGLVVRGYPRALRITVRTPAENDLLLHALGLGASPSERRSAAVLADRLRVSVVLDGNGRASVRTGDDERDDELEARARAAGWDLEVAAEPGTPAGAVEAALGRAHEQAGAARRRP
jgi:histidinol-phosphate aminotransferase